jgi:predicted SnoaL-like aldol condensation-catalyzing enzyme
MSPKKLVQDFYKSEAIIDTAKMNGFLHPDATVEWYSTKGFIKMRRDEIMKLTAELSKSYLRSKVRISHILGDGNLVSVYYTHHVKTIENPREEILLAHFSTIWEVREGKLYRCWQMSQLP